MEHVKEYGLMIFATSTKKLCSIQIPILTKGHCIVERHPQVYCSVKKRDAIFRGRIIELYNAESVYFKYLRQICIDKDNSEIIHEPMGNYSLKNKFGIEWNSKVTGRW